MEISREYKKLSMRQCSLLILVVVVAQIISCTRIGDGDLEKMHYHPLLTTVRPSALCGSDFGFHVAARPLRDSNRG